MAGGGARRARGTPAAGRADRRSVGRAGVAGGAPHAARARPCRDARRRPAAPRSAAARSGCRRFSRHATRSSAWCVCRLRAGPPTARWRSWWSRARCRDPMSTATCARARTSARGQCGGRSAFVVPGASACLRCVDAHRGEHDRDARWSSTSSPGCRRRGRPRPRRARSGLGRARRPTHLDGGVPSTWCATVELGPEL